MTRKEARGMPYKFKVWCPDCYGEDPYGCFGGDFELSEETYETIEAAMEAADEYVKDSIWDWSIVEVSSENPNEIIREYSDDYLVAYSLPNGQALDIFNLPLHTKRREQEKDRARARLWLRSSFGLGAVDAPEPPTPQTDADWKLLINIPCACQHHPVPYPTLKEDDLSPEFRQWINDLITYLLNNPPKKDMDAAFLCCLVYNLCGLQCPHPRPFRHDFPNGYKCDVCGEGVLFLRSEGGGTECRDDG
jgi:hypothetical protein